VLCNRCPRCFVPLCGDLEDLRVKGSSKWVALILLTTALFFWKLVFSHQFSILVQHEQANQAYAWYHFAASSLQQGSVPLWDPYANAGRTYVGGMETGLFYPPKLLLYLWPFNRSDLLSPQLYHYYYVLAHVLASCFLFFFALELGLTTYAAFVASLCFSLGGVMVRIPWPDMVDSGVWLPLILLFLLRSLRATSGVGTVRNACFAGLALGMSILAGRIHIVMMDVIVVVSTAAWASFRAAGGDWRARCLQPFAAAAITGVFAGCFGAVQLLPSVEYSGLAVRHIGAPAPVEARGKILYTDLKDEFRPRAIVSLLFPTASGGSIGGEGLPVYFGIMPLLLACLGVWRNWDRPWVRYLSAIAVAGFLFTLGPYSWLHGLSYALIPLLWIARGAARFVYLTHFALALLAGFGVNWMMAWNARDDSLRPFLRMLTWGVVVLAAGLGLPALYGRPEISDWIYLSFMLVLASYALFGYLNRSGLTASARFLVVILILFDLYAFDWLIQDRAHVQRTGTDYLDQLLRTRELAAFLKTRPGLFRVYMDMEVPPNIGDLYGVQTLEANAATEMRDFLRFRTSVPGARDLLNVRYTVRRSSAGNPGPVWSNGEWKVYENPVYCPRAWIVYRVARVTSSDEVLSRLRDPDFDALAEAIVAGPALPHVEPAAQPSAAKITFDLYRASHIEMSVETASAGLLVVSEMDFPGWKAFVDGRPVPVHKVDGLLRGIEVPAGRSKVVMAYRPASVLIGAILSVISVLGAVGIAVVLPRFSRPTAETR
jgi:hypothetical protein